MPHPYIVRPHHAGGLIEPGTVLPVDLTLIGPAIERANAAIGAARSIARDDGSLAFEGFRADPDTAPPRLPSGVRDWRLSFETPLRLRRSNRVLGPGDIDVPAIWGAVSRRLSMLHQIACGTPLVADFRALKVAADRARVVESELSWRDWFRVSGRQRRRIPLGGAMGALVLRDLVPEHLEWLALAQPIHIGRGTVFGLGAYRLDPVA